MVPAMFISPTLSHFHGFVNATVITRKYVLCHTFEEMVQRMVNVDAALALLAARTNQGIFRTIFYEVIFTLVRFLVDEMRNQETFTR